MHPYYFTQLRLLKILKAFNLHEELSNNNVDNIKILTLLHSSIYLLSSHLKFSIAFIEIFRRIGLKLFHDGYFKGNYIIPEA